MIITGFRYTDKRSATARPLTSAIVAVMALATAQLWAQPATQPAADSPSTQPAAAAQGFPTRNRVPGNEPKATTQPARTPSAERIQRLRERIKERRERQRQQQEGGPLRLQTGAKENPEQVEDGVRRDAGALPEVSDDRLRSLRERLLRKHGRLGEEETIETSPTSPQPGVPDPRTPDRPTATATPGAPAPGAQTPTAPGAPGPGTPTPGAADGQPGAAAPGVAAPGAGEIPMDPRTGLPQPQNMPGFWKLPPEERIYFFSWQNTPLSKCLDDMAEISGLNKRIGEGVDEKADLSRQITYQSDEMMTYDEALTEFNLLLGEYDMWVLRRDNQLVIRKFPDWYRHIPPERRFSSVEEYEEAALPAWELVVLYYRPKLADPSLLAAQGVDVVPLMTVQTAVVPDMNLIELKGFVIYVEWALDAIRDADIDPDDGRELIAYELKYATPEDAASMLMSLMPSTPGLVPVEATETPQPQPNPRNRRRRARTPSPGAAASVEVDNGIEIEQDTRQNRLMVRATPTQHKEVKELLEKYIDVPKIDSRQTEIIPLDYADPAEAVEIIQSMLGEQKMIQPPAPPQKKGQPQKPAPPPRMMSMPTTSVLTPLPQANSIIAKANPDEMAQIKRLIKLIDVEQDESSFQYIELQHASANSVSTMLTGLLSGQQRFTRGRRMRGGSQDSFRAIADTVRDNGLVLTGSPHDIQQAKELIAKIDQPEEDDQERYMIRLKNASPSTLATSLNQMYQGGGGGYNPYRRYGGGGGGSSDPRFIPEESSKTLIVVCREDQWPEIEQQIQDFDENNAVRMETEIYRLEHAEAMSIYSVVSQGLTGGGGRRWNDPTAPQVNYDASNNAVIVTASQEDQEKAAELIKELDVDTMAGAVEHIVQLENATPTALSQMLSQRFGSGGSSRYYYGGGGSSNKLPRFIADDNSQTLIVISREQMWPEIRNLINEIDSNSQVAQRTVAYRLEHASANSVSSILSQSMSSRRRWNDPNAPQFASDNQTNTVLVTANDATQERAKELITELDQPGPGGEAELRAIELQYAESDYVADKIEELFQGSRGRRNPYAGITKPQPVVVAEQVSNRVLITSVEDDYEEAKALAERIDQDYEAKESIRQTFMLEYAETWEVADVLETLFGGSRSAGRFRGARYGRGAVGPEGVSVTEISGGIIVQAPKDEMPEIESTIKELDVDRAADVEMRTYQISGTDYRGTYEIARNLTELYEAKSGYAGGRGSRQSSRSDVRFIGTYGSDLLFVSAPKAKMPDVENQVQEVLDARDSTDLSMVIRHFDVKRAKPDSISDIVEDILETKYSDMASQGGGSWNRWSGGGPRVTAHPNSNKLMVTAPETLMPMVEDLIAEFDRAPTPSTTRIISLKTAKAGDLAPIVRDQLNDDGSGGSSRFSRRWWRRGSTSSNETDTLHVTPVESSNSIILRGPEDKVSDGQDLISRLDEQARPEGMFEVYKLKHADLFDVVGMLEDMVEGGQRGSPIKIRSDYQTNQIIVSAPPDQFPVIEQVVDMMEDIAEAKSQDPELAAGSGDVIGSGPSGTTKLYQVKGPAKEVAKQLDEALFSLLGWDAPFVKAFPLGNQIVVTGEPKQFSLVEEQLKYIEENPPPVKTMIRSIRVKDPAKVVTQMQRFTTPALRQQFEVRQIPRLAGKPDPLAELRKREIGMYTPAAETEGETTNQTSPYVPPMAVMDDLIAGVEALAWAQTAEVESSPEPAPTTQPATPGAPENAPAAATKEEQTYNVLMEAATASKMSEQAQILFDEEEGTIFVIGRESQVEMIQEVMDLVLEEMQKIEETAQSQFTVVPVNHVDVTVAATILEQMFNEQTPGRGRRAADAKRQRQQQKDQQPPQGDEEDGDAAGRRRREEAEAAEEADKAAQAAAAQGRIRVIPDPRTRTLIIRAPDELMPAIAELLFKIDRPSDRPPVDIRIFQLTELNAAEVERAIKTILGIEQQQRRMPRMPRGGARGADAQAQMIEQLQQQMLEMQRTTAATPGEEGDGKLSLNPAKEIAITSDATTNSIIVSAPEEGMKLVESLINKLESTRIPLQIRSFTINHGEADKVAEELEKIFAEGRGGGGRGRDGMTPSQGAGEVQIAADARTNNIIVRALEPDMKKIEPIIQMLDEPMEQDQVKIYPVEYGDAASLAGTLTQIFAADTSASGARAVRIVADGDTNSLLVWAPDNKQLIIKSKIEQLDQQVGARTEFKQIKLAIARATSVAEKLEELFGQRTRGRGRDREVIITADNSTQTLFVSAPEEIYKEIEEYAQMMDVPSSKDIRIFPLEYAEAPTIEQHFKTLLLQAMATLSGGSASDEMFAVTADARTNSLIVAGTPAVFLAVEKVLAELDVAPGDASPEQVAMFPLTGGNARAVAQAVNNLFEGTTKLQGVKPPRAVPAGQSVVYIHGTGNQIDRIENEIIKPMEDYQKPLQTPMQEYTLDVEHADVDAVADKIRQYFQNRNENLRIAKFDRLSPQEMAVGVMADPVSRKLFISSSEANRAVIEELVKTFDTPTTGEEAGQVFEVIPVQYADLGHTVNAVTTAFRQPRGVPERERITIVAEYGTQSIVVKALPDDMEQIKDLIERIDNPDTSQVKAPKTIKVEHVLASKLAGTLNNQIQQTMRRDRRTGQYPVSVTADDSSNTLLITANPNDMQRMEKLVSELDVQRDTGDDRVTKTYAIRYAELWSTRNVINERFKDAASLSPSDQVQATVVGGTNSLVITASPENHKIIEDLLADVDESPIASRQTYTIHIEHADADSVAQVLTRIYDRAMPRARDNRVHAVFNVPQGASKILVTTTEDELPTVKELIDQLDVPETAEDKAMRVVAVRNISPQEMSQIIQEFMSKPGQSRRRRWGGAELIGGVTVTASSSTNAVVLTGPAEQLDELEDLIHEVDESAPDPNDPETGRQVAVLALENADPNSVAAVIRSSFGQRGRNIAEADRVDAIPERGTNSVVVTATTDKLEQIKSMVTELDSESVNTPEQVVIEIEHVEAEDLQRVLTQTYRGARRGRRGPPISFTAEPSNNKLVVSAGQSDLEEIRNMIAQLDTETSADDNNTIRVIEVRNVAPQEMAQVIEDFLRKPGQRRRRGGELMGGVTVAASRSSNAIALTGPRERLDELENLIREVDDSAPDPNDPETGRQVAVLALENANPNSVAAAITRSFGERGRNIAESDRVDAVPERGTNSVVVTATADKLKQIKAMVAELDSESANTPQQVVIELKNAQAEDIESVLSQTYRASRRRGGGPPISFAAEGNSNALVISAGQADLEGIRKMIDQLDQPASDSFQELRIMPLEHLDAAETVDILSEYLAKPTGRRRRRGGSDLIGGIKVQASEVMNAVIVSGSGDDLDRVQEIVTQMDKEVTGGGTAPRIIKLEHAIASQVAETLTEMFTEPARLAMRRNRNADPTKVPLIFADEGTNSLLVRARNMDYTLIEDTAKTLDTEPTGPNTIEVIPVSRSMNVAQMAGEIERVINSGERYRARSRGQRPGQISIGVDERIPAFLLSGSPELFAAAKQMINELNTKSATGGIRRTLVVPVSNLPAQEVKSIVDQMIEAQTGRSSGGRSSRGYRRRR